MARGSDIQGIKTKVASLFTNELQKPFILTDTQAEIFEAIFTRGKSVGHNRLHIMTYTQFGKSDVVSMAVLLRVATYPEKWCLVAPSTPKAGIIMSYLIRHVFDNEYFLSRFQGEKGKDSQRLRHTKSRNRLTFNVGNNGVGEIFVLSAESRIKTQDVGNAMMGFGAPNVVMDEAALVSDNADAKAIRMVGGFSAGGGDFVAKIGNPFTRGHFLKAYQDPEYYKINADYKVGLREGRLSKKFIEEMRKKPFFDVQYQNKFPRADAMDSKGWVSLLTEEDIERAMTDEAVKHAGEKRMGLDIARGGADSTIWCVRSMNYAEIALKAELLDDLTVTAAHTIANMETYGIEPINMFVDETGLGGGVLDMLRKERQAVQGVNAIQRAIDSHHYSNRRAEAYWRLRKWIKEGGKLSQDESWFGLAQIKYKTDGQGRVRIISKVEMKSHGFDSPDAADALSLTFMRDDHSITEALKRRGIKKRWQRKMRNKGVKVSMGGY